MSDLSLFKKLLLKDLDEKVIAALGAIYGQDAFKGVQELLNDATPFKIAASVSVFFHLVVLFTRVGLFLALQLSHVSFFGTYMAKYSDIRQY